MSDNQQPSTVPDVQPLSEPLSEAELRTFRIEYKGLPDSTIRRFLASLDMAKAAHQTTAQELERVKSEAGVLRGGLSECMSALLRIKGKCTDASYVWQYAETNYATADEVLTSTTAGNELLEMLDAANEVAMEAEFACKHFEGDVPPRVRRALEKWQGIRDTARGGAK